LGVWDFVAYKSADALLEEQLPLKREVNKIVLHYTAIPHPPMGKAINQLEAIDNYHREHNRWKGIGYHIAIHPSGLVIACRPLRLAGAHANGHNLHSIGVVMMCDADYLQTNPPLLHWVVVDTLKTLCIKLGIDRENVFLHRQLNKTQCPPITKHFEEYLHKAGFTSISTGE
jgi:hypothetical protein